MEQRSLFYNVSDGCFQHRPLLWSSKFLQPQESSPIFQSTYSDCHVADMHWWQITCFWVGIHFSTAMTYGDLQLQILSFATMVSYKSYSCKMKTRKNTWCSPCQFHHPYQQWWVACLSLLESPPVQARSYQNQYSHRLGFVAILMVYTNFSTYNFMSLPTDSCFSQAWIGFSTLHFNPSIAESWQR